MAKLRSDALQQLLAQAHYAPFAKRLAQLDACDSLARLVVPGRRYPYEFICFHLTGYRPRKGSIEEVTIPAADLLADLPRYAAELSKPMHIAAKTVTQKAYTLGELAERFGVSAKTVARWRSSGLVGRYLVFSDGRRRLAFLAAAVEHFRRRNRARLKRGRDFSRLSQKERQAVQARLRRMAARCPERRQEAIRRVAKRFGRSVEVVRQVAARLEQGGQGAVFMRRREAVAAGEAKQLCDLFERGTAVEVLTERFGRGKSTVYRVLKREQARRLAGLTIAYVACSDFTLPGAHGRFCNAGTLLLDETSGTRDQGTGDGRLAMLETYAWQISATPLLNHRQEQFLFAKYNYLKYYASKLQKEIDLAYPQARVIDRMRGVLREVDEIKDRLIRSNLRLVISVSRKHARGDADMLELISEGNVTLLNAVEKFDFKRGFRFSTYATWAMVKRFASARRVPKSAVAQPLGEEELEVARDLRVADSKVVAVESARKSLAEVMAETLAERERLVVREHYGLTDKTELIGQRKPKSLREIAAMVGLSKEGIRRVELVALQKLRRALSREQFELLTGQ